MANLEAQKTWQKALNSLEIDISPAVFNTFFKNTQAETYDRNIITILVNDRYQKENLELRYYGQIKSVLDDVTGEKNEIIFKIGFRKEESSLKESLPLFRENTEEEKTKLWEVKAKEGGFATFYTFKNFIVGENNNLAHAVAQAIVASPGKMYNPLFIYSGVGLGKTHLIQAIGNEIIRKHPHLKVLYCTGESFMNELVESITEGRKKTFMFRKKFRAADVLIIDDVQFIAGRESTQEELFNTFNTLHQERKQIIFASDRPPKEIPKLEERLSSRFAAGMITRMDPPDLEMRLAILRYKQTEIGSNADDAALETIARLVRSNVRELEGAFLQTVSSAHALKRELSKELVFEVLGKNHNLKEAQTATPQKILNAVSKQYEVLLKDLKGPSRKAAIARARQICMYTLRHQCQLPYESIGSLLGKRDHTTVLYGEEKIARLLKKDKTLAEEIHKLSTTF